MTSKSEPRDLDRCYSPENLDAILVLIDEEGIKIDRRDGLLQALSRAHYELTRATDPRDVASLEHQVRALISALDLKVHA